MEEDGSMLRPDGDQPIGFGPTTFGLTTCGRFTALPVLIILHGPMSTPGRVGNALRAMGHPLDIRCLKRSITMPGRSLSAGR